MYAACHVKRTVLECRATWVHVVGSGDKLLCCVEFICRLMYGPGLPVSLSQTPSVHGWILCLTVLGACQRADLDVCSKRHLSTGAGTWEMCQINTPSLVYCYFYVYGFICVNFLRNFMCTQGTSVDALADALIVTGVKVHTVRIIPGIVVAFDF